MDGTSRQMPLSNACYLLTNHLLSIRVSLGSPRIDSLLFIHVCMPFSSIFLVCVCTTFRTYPLVHVDIFMSWFRNWFPYEKTFGSLSADNCSLQFDRVCVYVCGKYISVINKWNSILFGDMLAFFSFLESNQGCIQVIILLSHLHLWVKMFSRCD